MIDQANKMGEILKSMMPPEERRATNLALQARLIKRLAELQAELDAIPKTTAAATASPPPAPTLEQRLEALERQQRGHIYGPMGNPLVARGFFVP